MADITLLSDLVMSAGFFAMAALCAYRLRVHGGSGPEFLHLRPILVSCVVAGTGAALRGFWSPASVLCGVGMAFVACAYAVRIKAIVRQPTWSDVQDVVRRVGAVEEQVADLSRRTHGPDAGSGPIE